MQRRTFLAGGASLLTAGTAGCVGDDGGADDSEESDASGTDGDGTDTADDAASGDDTETEDGGDGATEGTPAGVVDEFYALAMEYRDDTETFVAEGRELLHSESPLRGRLDFYVESRGSQETDQQSRELQAVETAVGGTDIGKATIEERFGGVLPEDASADLLAGLADDNAVVEAQLTFAAASPETQLWLVTPQDREWVIFTGGITG